jgi:MFS family permease
MPAGPSRADLSLMQRNLRLLPWWWVLRWVWLGEGIWVIYLTQERGLTLGEAFLFEAVFSGAVIATELPMGMVADRFGRRLALILGGCCVVLGFLTFGIGTSLYVLIAAYVLLALADTNFSGADAAMLYDSLKSLGRDQDFTVWHGRLNAIIAGAIGLFTVVGSVMVHWWPLWTPIVVSAVASAPALILAWFMTEPPSEGERHAYMETGRRAIGLMLRTPSIWAVTVVMALTTQSIALVAVLQQQFLLNAGIPVWAVGLFVAVQMLLGAGASWISEPVGRRLTLRRVFLLMPVLSGLAIMAAAPGTIWLYPVFIFPAFGWNIMYPHFSDYVSRRVPDSLRATLISLTSLATALMALGFVPLVGLAVDRLGFGEAALIASLAITLASGGFYAIWLRAGDTVRMPVDAPSTPAVP